MAQFTVGTQEVPYPGIFVANADASLGGALVQPDIGDAQGTPGQGEIQGTVRLGGSQSSLGAYIQVGQETHFVDSAGSFRMVVPSGTLDIFIRSPGHVPAHLPNTMINPGELLTLPEVTLPFGEANGDGKIDILDLSIAASNFGETAQEMTLP